MSINPQPQQPKKSVIETELLKNSSVQTFWNSLKPYLDKLASLPGVIDAQNLIFKQKMMDVEVNGQLSKEGKLEQAKTIRDAALADLARQQQDAQKAVTELNASLNRASQTPDADATDKKLLTEMQIARIWQRVKPLLDAHKEGFRVQVKAQSLATEASQKTDGQITLRALQEELPAYLEARGMAGYTEQIMHHFAACEVPFLSPVQLAARQVAHVCDGGWGRILASIQMAERYYSQPGAGKPIVAISFYITERMKF
jgi:hypothetical protein